jgi:hypothetical protein
LSLYFYIYKPAGRPKCVVHLHISVLISASQPAEAPSPYAGGVAARGAGGGSGNAIVDVLWFVFRWANDAYAAAGRRKDQ